jgi:hypothetical protein
MQQMGTHGSLEDMNVIDLLQAIGHTQKTVRISVTGHGSQLSMCIDQGRLVFAECEQATGAEAIYRALVWQHGVWSVDPIEPRELPEPNNDEPIDSILIEGCRRMDEHARGDSETMDSETETELDDIFS